MAKRYLAWYAGFVVSVGLVGPMLMVYAIDPLQLFRRAPYAAVFSTNERYQLPGLARNYDYDTVIVGSSMAQNFYLGYADRELRARTLKLAISGSSAHEQFLILNVALRTGKVKRVVWSLDQWEFRGSPQRVRDDLGVFPYDLYEPGLFGYFWYLFNGSNVSESVAILTDRSRIFGSAATRVPDDWNTFDKFYRFSRVNALRDFFNPENYKSFEDVEKLQKDYDLSVMERSFRENTLAVVQSHPKIEFDVYFPPYSILNAKFYQKNFPPLFRRLIDFQNLVIRSLVGIKNVRLFDFSDVTSITQNLDLYKDMGHFDVSVNEYIIRSIATGRHRVDPVDPEASTRRLAEQAAAYPTPQPPTAASSAPTEADHQASR